MNDPARIEFVGGDEDSGTQECPGVWVTPGGVYFRGKKVDPATSERLSVDIVMGEDEADVWLPDRMFDVIREAIAGRYEFGREGSRPDFAYLVQHTNRSVVRLEMRDAYDPGETGFAEWKRDGTIDAYDWGDWPDIVGSAVKRGVSWRRVRIVSEPVSEYIRFEHAITVKNIEFGEDIRWLPRTKAADLLLPGADCWVFDHRIVRWNFQRGDNSNPMVYTYSSDPRVVRDIVGAFEMAWDRAISHDQYKV